MCLFSKPIKNRKYVKNKKNGGFPPPVPDVRMEWIRGKCGNCIECRKEKANNWRTRLLEEIKTNTNGKFITLTFSNESIQELHQETIKKTDKETGQINRVRISDISGYAKDNAIATLAMRRFNERWRKEKNKSIRHWMITELGHEGTENIHLHGIMWTNEHIDEIRRIWKYGWIWPRPKQKIKTWVNGQTINYMMKYVTKIDPLHKEYNPRILASNKPGIGHEYINSYAATKNEFKGRETNRSYRTTTGHQIILPPYYKNKLYTDAEKEAMWIYQLDKNEIWIRGERIDISNGMQQYEKALQWHRRINAELGYGGQPNENRKEHEEAKRDTLYKKRIENI